MKIDAGRMMVKAIENDDLDMAVKALSHGLDPRTYINNSYHTALIRAVRHRCEKIAQHLILYSDCNQQSYYGTTALICASYHGYTDILKLLLPHTDLTLRDRDGDIEDYAKLYRRTISLGLIQLWKSLIRNGPKTHMIIKMCLQWHEISMPTDFYEETVKYWLIVSLDKN